ncbi:MAG: hypothetical protein WDN49_21610 [Acetobacteraceae bacterium]
MASALVHGSVRLDGFTEARLQDPRVQTLMQRVEMAVDPGCDAAFPSHRSAVVEIETADGQSLRHHQPTRKGDPDAPLTDDELAGKFFELVTPVLGEAAAHRLLHALRTLDAQGSAAIADLGREGASGLAG